MKTFTRTVLKKTTFILLFACGLLTAAAQAPELVFRNPVLISGTALQDGAKYRFSNVTSGVDAILEIKGRSSSQVVINSIDINTTGWDKALQPEVGIPGTVGSLRNWWAEFRIRFYQAGTNNNVQLTTFKVTGIDIDGDGGVLNEWVEMDKIDKLDLSPATMLVGNLLNIVSDILNPNNSGCDYRIVGPTTNFSNIDTAGTGVMATYTFNNKNEISFRLGGSTGLGSTNAAMRMNSLWFKSFDLSTHTLPVNLFDFSAVQNRNKVDLKWTTAQESNLSHFVVEKSYDGKQYTDAALVFAYGNSSEKKNYSYSDNISGARAGMIYYRLKMQDLDGSFTYSNVRMIKTGGRDESLVLQTWPNPVTDQLKITLPDSWQGKALQIELYAVNGQKMQSRRTEFASQIETVSVSGLQAGVYIVRVSDGSSALQQKIIKN